MITKSQLKMASDEQKRKAKLCRTSERGSQVLVTPADKAKAKRIVLFLNEGILCISTNGEVCHANDYKRTCYHTLAAARRKVINRKARETRERNKDSQRSLVQALGESIILVRNLKRRTA